MRMWSPEVIKPLYILHGRQVTFPLWGTVTSSARPTSPTHSWRRWWPTCSTRTRSSCSTPRSTGSTTTCPRSPPAAAGGSAATPPRSAARRRSGCSSSRCSPGSGHRSSSSCPRSSGVGGVDRALEDRGRGLPLRIWEAAARGPARAPGPRRLRPRRRPPRRSGSSRSRNPARDVGPHERYARAAHLLGRFSGSQALAPLASPAGDRLVPQHLCHRPAAGAGRAAPDE